MIDNSVAAIHQRKINNLIAILEDDDLPEWKARQVTARLKKLRKKLYPDTVWDYGKGTYRKEKEA